MKRIVMLCMLCITFITGNVIGQRIKTAAYWTSPVMSMEHARALAVHDLVIADFENMFNNRQSLVELKRLNPKLKLLAYSNAQEIFEKTMKDRPMQTAWTAEIRQKYPNWILTTANQKKVVFYPGMQMINMSSLCPLYDVPGLGRVNYSQWMADLLLKKVFVDEIWDGRFEDNGGGNVSWVDPVIDADRDGRVDDPLVLDQAWSKGMHSYLSTFRAVKGKQFILIANKGSVEFMDVLDGRMFEWWPNDYLGDKRDGGWWQNTVNANQTGRYTILQVHERDVEFAIASALLMPYYEDIYIAVGHNSLRYPSALKTDLGSPKNNATIRRDFENGYIEVNPAAKTAIIKQK